MPLEPQEVEVPLTGGLNVKSGVEVADPMSSLSEVTDLRWNRAADLEKRPTFASEATPPVPPSSNVTSVRAMAIFARGTQVCTLTDHHGIAYIDPQDPAKLKYASHSVPGPVTLTPYAPPPLTVPPRQVLERAQFGRHGGGIWMAASALYQDVLVFAWIEVAKAGSRIKYRAVHATTGELITPTQSVNLPASPSSHAQYLQACAYWEAGKEGVLITYSAASLSIKTIRWQASTKTFVGDATLTTTSRNPGHTLTSAGLGLPEIYVSWTDNATEVIKVHRGTIAQISGGTSTVHTSTKVGTYPGCVVLGTTQALVAYHDGDRVYAECFGSPAGVVTALTAPAGSGYSVVTGAQELNADRAVLWAKNGGPELLFPGNDEFSKVQSVAVDFPGATPVAALASDTIPHARIATAGFSVDGRAYVGVSVVTDNGAPSATPTPSSVLILRHHSQGNGAFLRHDISARICHDVYYSEARGGLFGGYAGVGVDGDALVVLTGDPGGARESTAVDSLPQTLYLNRLGFTLDAAKPLPHVGYGGTLTVAAGVPFDFDGDTTCEHTPIGFPVVRVDAASSGTTTTTEVLSVMAIWRFVDNQARLHRSPPSLAATIPIVTSKRVDVYVSRPQATALDGEVPMHVLEPELYITKPGGGLTFYLALIPGTLGVKHTYDSISANGCWFVFTNAQPSAGTSPPIYSTGAGGDELPAEPPPALRDIAVVGDRLWAIDAEVPSRVWFTKPFSAGFAPEWSTFNTLTVGDACFAVRDLNGVPTIFGAAGIHQVYGDGPDVFGNGFFSPAKRLPYEIRCIDPLVCKTNGGIMFRAQTGFFLLSNGGELQSVGIPIETVTRLSSAAGHKPTRIIEADLSNEIMSVGQECHVLNTLEQKWSTWTQDALVHNIADACVADGNVWYLNAGAAGSTIRRLHNVFGSDGTMSTDGWSLATHWIKPDGLAGHGRLWRAWAVLALPSDPAGVAALTLQYAVDYAAAAVQTWVWTGAELAALYASGQRIVKLAVKPAQQVVTVCKFRLSCTFTTPAPGPRPLNLRLSYGVRPSKSKRSLPGVK